MKWSDGTGGMEEETIINCQGVEKKGGGVKVSVGEWEEIESERSEREMSVNERKKWDDEIV